MSEGIVNRSGIYNLSLESREKRDRLHGGLSARKRLFGVRAGPMLTEADGVAELHAKARNGPKILGTDLFRTSICKAYPEPVVA